MNNKNLLIGAGVVIVGYLLWKKSKSNTVTKSDVIIPQLSLTQQEKIDLFNKAIQQYQGGVRPPETLLDRLAKGREEANAKIKELKLDAEFSTWLKARPKVNYNAELPN